MKKRCLTCHTETDGTICASCEWSLSGRDIPRIEYYDELEAEAAALREQVKRLEEDYEQLKWKLEHIDDDTDYS